MSETPPPNLLPCPFCGKLPVISKHFKDPIWCLLHRCQVMGGMNMDWNDSAEALAKRWNTRTTPVLP